MSEKLSQAESNLERKLEWNSRFDTKVAFIMAFCIAMLATLADAAKNISAWSNIIYAVFATAFILLIVSIFFGILSQFPTTKSLNSSLVFFGTISKMKVDEFKKRFKQSSDEEYLDDILDQIHRNSEILTKKFRRLRISLIFISIAVVPWVCSLLMSKVFVK